MVMNRKYKNEIGIDFQGLFKGTPGTSLIWKRKKVGRLISLTFIKNYRFQVALSGTIPIGQKVTQVDTTKGHYVTREAVQYSIQPMFGIERVNFYGRFNFFYGMDCGPFYNYNRTGYTIFYYSNYNSGSATSISGFPANETSKIGLSIIPFLGIKYRIGEHFSASMESGFNLSYYFSDSKLLQYQNYYYNIQTNYNVVTTTSKFHGLSFNMLYLRFLTFNYHF